jgi:hypothetical protein
MRWEEGIRCFIGNEFGGVLEEYLESINYWFGVVNVESYLASRVLVNAILLHIVQTG